MNEQGRYLSLPLRATSPISYTLLSQFIPDQYSSFQLNITLMIKWNTASSQIYLVFTVIWFLHFLASWSGGIRKDLSILMGSKASQPHWWVKLQNKILHLKIVETTSNPSWPDFRASDRVTYFLPQTLHGHGAYEECVVKWSVKIALELKLLPQCSQTNGFSP